MLTTAEVQAHTPDPALAAALAVGDDVVDSGVTAMGGFNIQTGV